MVKNSMDREQMETTGQVEANADMAATSSCERERLTYLAAPYTHSDSNVMADRVQRLNAVATEMMREGKFIFNPLSHSDPLSSPDIPESAWYALDLRILSHCDEIIVVMLDGWRESVGVAKEIAFAKQNSIPLSYLDPNSHELTSEEDQKSLARPEDL